MLLYVDAAYKEKIPPDILYHGTVTRFISSIQDQGLLPLLRQYVHLSYDEATAIQVGQRHGKLTVLKIRDLNVYEQGFKFFQADSGAWLTDNVSYRFIKE